MLVDEVSLKSSLPGLLMAAFSLCLHIEAREISFSLFVSSIKHLI